MNHGEPPHGEAVRIQNDAPQQAGREYTNRGFDVYANFPDTYGTQVRVQLSSSADRAAVWIFATNPTMDDASPHLDVEQAQAVIDALSTFVRENTPARVE